MRLKHDHKNKIMIFKKKNTETFQLLPRENLNGILKQTKANYRSQQIRPRSIILYMFPT